MDSPCGKPYYELDSTSRMRTSSRFSWADMADDEEEDHGNDWQDNVMLLDKICCEANVCSDSSNASTCASTIASPERKRTESWCPNAAAPEFVPTLTVPCALVMDAYQLEAMINDVAACETPQRRKQEHSHSQESAYTPTGKNAAGRKSRRPSRLNIPERSGWMSTQWDSTWAMGDSVGSQQGQGMMPPATEEEWQRRIEMRWRAVELCKETRAYKIYNAQKPREMRVYGEPMTPDHTDRTVSKRTWKFNVHQWRLALMEFEAAEFDGNNSDGTATTETGGSCPLADVAEVEADAESSRGSCSS